MYWNWVLTSGFTKPAPPVEDLAELRRAEMQARADVALLQFFHEPVASDAGFRGIEAHDEQMPRVFVRVRRSHDGY